MYSVCLPNMSQTVSFWKHAQFHDKIHGRESFKNPRKFVGLTGIYFKLLYNR